MTPETALVIIPLPVGERPCVTRLCGRRSVSPASIMRTVKLRRTYVWGLFITGIFLYIHMLHIKNKGIWFDYENVHNDLSSIQSYRPEDIEDDDTILVNKSVADDLVQKVKVFCFIATTSDNLLTKAKAVNDTWGRRCDKILFVTSSPSKLSMTISFDIEDSRSHLTGKTMSMIDYIYRQHLNDYQWFMKADDDTYVVMENLKLLLSKCDAKKPIYLGHHLKMHLKQGYMSGGAGYVMSQSALRMLVEDGLDKDLCQRDGNDEDVDVGRCLENVGVKPYTTTDKFGRETFHAFSILNYIIGPVPVYLLQYPHKPARSFIFKYFGGRKYRMEGSGVTVDELILKYSYQNLSYKEMSYSLQKHHGVYLSHDAIRKRLKRMGSPSKRGPTINTYDEIKQVIQAEILGHPVTVGYRHMTYTLRHKGIHVRRDTVMKLMREIDPEGVDFRRRRRIRRRAYLSLGPNYTWHVDGYDKLKPFGFAIHGCIDGFSRRVMWLKVGPTNNNPKVTAAHYVECVDVLKGCPRILQADPGTENVILGAIQCVLRQNGQDCFAGERSFRTVRSVFNQRIEAWWSMFRRHESQWWMDLFKDLELFGAFDQRSIIDKYCLRYCFMPLLQQNLDMLRFQWNSHHISKSARATCPGGRPVVLFDCPELTGATDCLSTVSDEDILWAMSECGSDTRSGSQEFDSLALGEFLAQNWLDAFDVDNALNQYFHLRAITSEQH